jgi:tetratricopeptide (TPR) repeat protein
MFFQRRQPADSGAVVQERATWILREIDALRQTDPEDLVGDPREPLRHQMAVGDLFQAGRHEEAFQALDALLRKFPLDPSLRFYAAITCWHVAGDEARSLAHLGILIALEPEHPGAYRRLAYMMRLKGQEELAQKILEHGWRHVEKLYPRRHRAAERERFFAPLGRADTPDASSR